MLCDRIKYTSLATLVALGLVAFGVRHWVSASDGQETPGRTTGETVKADDASRPDDVRPGRRREAVIRLPAGTFTKEVDVPPYGSGRITFTYEDDRVLSVFEGSAMGGQFELATEAEYSLSSTGTIYGIITSVRLNHLRLPNVEEFAKLQPFAGLWPAVEPLINDVMIDLPFSYQFRVQGDRLVITNFRILLAGPNPLGKVGGLSLANGNDGSFKALAAFQALGTALEGTYTTPDGRDKPGAPARRLPQRPRGQGDPKGKR